MSKRKRDDGADDQPRSRKKRKSIKQKNREKRASQHGSSFLDQPAKLLPPGRLTTQTAERKPSARPLEPPAGLSKRQRKRWRRRQSELTNPLKPGQHETKKLTKVSVPPEQQSPQKRDANAHRKSLDRDTLLQAASTQLMVRRSKAWPEDNPTHKGANWEGSERLSHERKHSTSQGSDSPPRPSPSPVATQVQPAVRVSRAVEPDSTQSFASRDSPAIVRQAEVRLKAPILPKTSFRRTSFGQKVNSIPVVTSSEDPAIAFKRFSTFVNKGDSDDESEDDESNESGSESGDGDRPTQVRNGTNAAKSTSTNKTMIQGSQRSRAQSVDSVSRFGPRDAVLAASQASNAGSQRANVGIKRQNSFLGPTAGGTQSGSGSAPPAAITTTPSSTRSNIVDPFNVSEADSMNALQYMEDLTENMLTTTRALPASKSNRGLDLRSDDGTDGLTNADSSHTRLKDKHVNLARFRSFNDYDAQRDYQPVSIVCNAVQVPSNEFPEGTVELKDAQQTTSETSGSSNIVVAFRQRNDMSPASSTSLSERSETPTPPAEDIRSDGHAADERINTPEIPTEVRQNETNASLSAAKKRKMTGRTSKHFTPLKQTKRRKSKAGIDLEQTPNTGVLDEGIQGESSTHDEDMLGSSLRSETSMSSLQTPVRRSNRIRAAEDDNAHEEKKVAIQGEIQEAVSANDDQYRAEEIQTPVPKQAKKKRKSTGKKSSYFTPQKPPLDTTYIDRVDLYNTTGSTRKGRVPAGVSIAPVPSIQSPTFGIIQEKLWREPFWLLIAVTFLNKTTGRAAAPTFWRLKEKYDKPEDLAEADEEELREMIHHLGLQTQRSKRMIKMARAWIENEPMMGRRWRCLHYPLKGDGKEYKPDECVEEDAEEVSGALEIARIPGCGPYAWDSWRIFCRDVLRGVAQDYNGQGAGEGFVPEWKKVLPLDKELRAALRWMWLREGWIWDCVTGERRAASEEEMERAVMGEAEIDDPAERKFAAQAAGKAELLAELNDSLQSSTEDVTAAPEEKEDSLLETPSTPKMSAQRDESDVGSNIIVTPKGKQGLRRSMRLSL